MVPPFWRSLGFLTLTDVAHGQAPATQQPAPPPIRAFDLPTLEKLGREIYRQDTAAWVATDALLAATPEAAKELRGWIVEDRGRGQVVRFLRAAGQGIELGYDVAVDEKRQTSISIPADRALSTEERAEHQAVETARANLPGVCRPGYNSVVMKDPQGDGWLVWWLAPQPAKDTLPVGGHFRFTVSKDGGTVLRRDALSVSCLTITPPVGVDGEAAAAFASHVVSPTPVETHVFVQLESGRPLFVLAGGYSWLVDGGKITRKEALRPPK